MTALRKNIAVLVWSKKCQSNVIDSDRSPEHETHRGFRTGRVRRPDWILPAAGGRQWGLWGRCCEDWKAVAGYGL